MNSSPEKLKSNKSKPGYVNLVLHNLKFQPFLYYAFKSIFFKLPLASAIFLTTAKIAQGQTVTPLTSITSHRENAAVTNYTTGTLAAPTSSNSYTWGGSNGNLILDGVTIGTNNYAATRFADQIILKRVNNINHSGNVNFIWAEDANPGISGNPYQLSPAYPGSNMENALLGNIINRGSDNIFNNGADAGNNIERIDYIFSSGIKVVSPSTQGFVVLERGGNDNFKIAGVKTLSGSNPTSYNPLASVTTANWGGSIPIVTDTLKDPPSGSLPFLPFRSDILSQEIKGVFISFATLGFAAGDTVYGYSLVGNDANNNCLITPNNSNCPLNTNDTDGGMDFISGGGVFSIADFGDAPDSYGTNSSNNNGEGFGASHTIVSTLKLGATAPDSEIDAQTPLNGTGDNTTGVNDEDGISIFPSLSTSTASYSLTATVNNTTGSPANVYAWFDFDRDGKFDGDERAVVSNGTITLDSNGKVPTGSNGTVTLTWNNLNSTGANVVSGNSYIRIRLTTNNLTTASATATTRDPASVGTATNGEVEDYPITIGFKSNPSLATNFCTASSRNLLFILDDSSSVTTTELIQQREAVMATLYDFVAKNLTGQAAIVGFDGLSRTVINYTNITAANLTSFQTALNNNYGVDGSGTHWDKGFQAGLNLGVNKPNVVFFFTDGPNNSGNNPDGLAAQFKNAGAHIYGIGIEIGVGSGFAGITDGSNTVTYNGSNIADADFLPITDYSSLKDQYTNAFLRNLCPADFGDAPDTYGTDNIANNNSNTNPIGANHAISANLFLGATSPDTDANGFVDGVDNNSNATDDDTTASPGNGDDEDGLTIPSLGTGATSYTIPASNIRVTNSTTQTATLHGWIDFNKNGKFDANEYASATVNASTNNGNPTADLTWNGINLAGQAGNTYARFRLTTDSAVTNNTPGGAATNGEVEDYQIAIATPPNPNVLLVKRITAINPGQTTAIKFNGFVDDPGTTNDNHANWPNNDDLYLSGQIEVGNVKPGDEVEYTIYFLSNGNALARNLNICDVIPDNMTFVSNSYGSNFGMALGLNDTSLPTATNVNLSNALGDDQGDFYPPNTNPAINNLCKKHDPNNPNNLIPLNSSNNVSGAVLIKLNTPIPAATSPGTPPNSYGFIRFRGKVK